MESERSLGRTSPEQISAIVGYAGGVKVCGAVWAPRACLDAKAAFAGGSYCVVIV